MRKKPGPVVAFDRFYGFLKTLKSNAIDGSIRSQAFELIADRGLASRVDLALRWLSLIDQRGTATSSLRVLVDSIETDNWAPEFEKVLRKHYKCFDYYDNVKVSSHNLALFFFNKYSNSEQVLIVMFRFFHAACKSAGIEPPGAISIADFNANIKELAKADDATHGATKPIREGQEQEYDEAGMESAIGIRNVNGEAAHRAGKRTNQLPSLPQYPDFNPTWIPEIQLKWMDGYARMWEASECCGCRRCDGAADASK